MTKKKVLFGIPPKNHVNLAMDEFHGFQKIGYECDTSTYSRNKPTLNKFSKLWALLQNAFTIVLKLHKNKPNILYLNSRVNAQGVIRDFISIWIFRLFYWKKPLIAIKSHGSDLSMLDTNSFSFKRIIFPWLNSNVNAWLFLSEEEKINYLELFPDVRRNAFVTYNIIDPKRSIKSDSFKEKYGIRDDLFTFLFVGRMVRKKGCYAIIEGLSKCKFKDEVEILMLGDGLELEILKKYAKELNVENSIRFLGFINEDESDHFYANVDALVFPSLEEGFAMALFKSVCSGLPIITTQIRAAADQLTEDDNCLWVNGESGESVSNALSKIYNNKNLRDKMSENNLKLGKKYSQMEVCKSMKTIFESIQI